MVRRVSAACAAFVLCLLALSCETENVGGVAPDWSQYYTYMTLNVAVPAGMTDGAAATWTLTINGGLAPFTVDWNFGGGANPNTFHVENAAHPDSTVTTSMQQGTWVATVTVTDLTGLSATTSVNYTVGGSGPPPPIAPTVDSATYDAGTQVLTVNVSTTEAGETLTVHLQVPAGFAIDANDKVAVGGVATFNITATNPAAGATGTFVVTATDTDGDTSQPVSVNVTIAPVVPVVVPADTLVAVPQAASAQAAEAVTVLVSTGVPANPFQYMNGVGLTVNSDASYVANSFNIGALGGATADGDGIWSNMNGGTGPTGGFLLPPDNFIIGTDIGGGRERWDFNVTPIGGSNLTGVGGDLFNAQFTFTAMGTKTFGFQDVSGVKRTYYSDGSLTEYFWADITNNVTGFRNSVDITTGTPFTMPADTIAAIPQATSAATGAAVTVLVETGAPANPFQYMNGVGIVLDTDASYVANSFNVGAVGGAAADADGIWANMNGGAGPSGFLLAPDNFIIATDIGGGKERYDFNVTPTGGSNLTGVGGSLFNCQFTFANPGNHVVGLEQFNGVKRTYYSEGNLTEYFWGDVSNNVGAANSVTVN